MSAAQMIRILEKDNNKRGDLFSRLVSDLFVSLGYDPVRRDVARSGREIDLEAEHRLEPRIAIAECKAMKDPAGGTDLNAFAGKLRTEKKRHKERTITPYFVSLSGFTETAKDQETEAAEERLILLDGAKVIEELVRGHFLVSQEQAIERAGRLAAVMPSLSLHDGHEVLGHQMGWIWAIYFGQGKQRTHFALVHADGTPLSLPKAREVQEAGRGLADTLHELACLNPNIESSPTKEALEQEAVQLYRKYITEECGYIQLDGLPADADAGTRRPQLENLFVPLHLELSPKNTPPEAPLMERKDREPVGEVLAANSRLAILASPGGGKSTLLKRLAVAYADPSRRLRSSDNLPEREWFPVFLRCRELRHRVSAPFPELLDTLSERACIGRELAAPFRSTLERALRDGNVLLLVDGLDEISNPGDRQTFVRNLRTFLGMYPEISLVVTSREAGFRQVAGLLATVCRHATLADFAKEDIERLTLSWHREIFGDRPEILLEAQRLASSIASNDRIRRLAVNPLLLTTLLLVKRWVGQLPTRRTVLYGKAIEVLLMTWNVEGHAPIELEEALPQLCYLAHTMMTRGVEKISRSELARTLRESRQQLSAELAYARIGVSEFIDRIELRSSLLMMSGHDVVDGSLEEFYEFRHLTFQEYLTAKALVEGWYRGRQDSDTLQTLLQPHGDNEKWREAIPLAAVLAGRRAEGLLRHLVEVSTTSLLAECLSDEVQASPGTIDAAIGTLVESYSEFDGYLPRLVDGKYGALFIQEARRVFLTSEPTHMGATSVLAQYSHLLLRRKFPEESDLLLAIESTFASEDWLHRCEGLFGLAIWAYEYDRTGMESVTLQRSVASIIANLPSAGDHERFASLWALAWIGEKRLCLDRTVLDVDSIFRIWHGTGCLGVRRMAAFCFYSWPLLPRDQPVLTDSPSLDTFVTTWQSHFDSTEFDGMHAQASLVSGYYLHRPEIDDAIQLSLQKYTLRFWKTGEDLLEILTKKQKP